MQVTSYDNFDDFIQHELGAVIFANYFHEHTPFAIECFEKKKDHTYCMVFIV